MQTDLATMAEAAHRRQWGLSIGRGVRSYLLAMVFLCLGSAGAAALVSLYWNHTTHRDWARLEMTRTVRAFAAALDQDIDNTILSLRGLGDILSEDDSLERLHRVALVVQGRNPHWSQVTLRDENGQPLMTTAVAYGNEFPRIGLFRDVVREALASGEPQITNLVFGPISREFVVGILVPVRDQAGGGT